MVEFKYKAVNKSNNILEGKYLADSEEELMLSLRDKGYYLLEFKKNNSRNISKKVSKKELLFLCEQLSILLFSGITIAKSLEILQKQNFSKVMRCCIGKIKLEVIKGNQLYKSMMVFENIFPKFMIEMIRVGEESGNLDKTIEYLTYYYDKECKIENDIKTALTYPTIVFCVSIIIVVLLTVNAVPIFTNILFQAGAKVPPLTSMLIVVSNSIKNNFEIVLIVIASVYFVFKYSVVFRKKIYVIIDNFTRKIPYIYNLKLKIFVKKFSMAMSMLLESGISIIDSLQIIKFIIENEKIEKEIGLSIEDITNGKDTVSAFKNISIFNEVHISMIQIGQECGKLDDIFNRISIISEKEIECKTKRLVKCIEPGITIILSIFIGLIIIALIFPMISIVDSIGI